MITRKKTLKLIFTLLGLIVVLVGISILVISFVNRNAEDPNPISYPVSSIVNYSNELNSYSGSDTYTFKYDDSWYIQKEILTTVILAPQKYKDNIIHGRFLTITLKDSFGDDARTWLLNTGSDYIVATSYLVNGNDAFKADYGRDEYYERRYVVHKNEKVVEINYRIWSYDLGVRKDYSEFEDEVEEIVNSIDFLN